MLVAAVSRLVGGVVVVQLADPDTQKQPLNMDFLAAGLSEVEIRPTRDRPVFCIEIYSKEKNSYILFI